VHGIVVDDEYTASWEGQERLQLCDYLGDDELREGVVKEDDEVSIGIRIGTGVVDLYANRYAIR
jgi:hypothetical protein